MSPSQKKKNSRKEKRLARREKEKLLAMMMNDEKGQFGIGQFLLALLLLGIMTQWVLNGAQTLNTQYGTNLNTTKYDRFNIIGTKGQNLTNNFIDTTLGKEIDKTLQFNNLPTAVWSSMKTLITGVVSGPAILNELLLEVFTEFGIDPIVTTFSILALKLLLIIVMIGGVLRTEI